jgi:hypothetical protein
MINYLKELSDFGLLILIWLVQLIIYPSFTYMDKHDLRAWHPTYTKMITVIVLPLMLVQLFTTFYLTFANFNWLFLTQSILIVFLWASTFFQAVPLHNQIENGKDIKTAANNLVQVNWKRTIMWSFIVALNFVGKFTT